MPRRQLGYELLRPRKVGLGRRGLLGLKRSLRDEAVGLDIRADQIFLHDPERVDGGRQLPMRRTGVQQKIERRTPVASITCQLHVSYSQQLQSDTRLWRGSALICGCSVSKR